MWKNLPQVDVTRVGRVHSDKGMGSNMPEAVVVVVVVA
jgi:hypothetical protein